MKSIFDISVSCIPNYYAKDEIEPVNLLAWLKSDKYKVEIERIRSEPNKKIRDRLKGKLPQITPHGIVEKYLVTQNHKSHSGLLYFDLDGKDNPHVSNWENLREQLAGVNEIAYCGLSASARGLWGMVQIQFPHLHREHFEALWREFRRYDLTLDQGSKSLVALRCYSYDPDQVIKHQVPKFNKTYKEPEPRETFSKKPYNSQKRVLNLIDKINRENIDITQHYEEWIRIAYAFAEEFGGQGRELFHQISSNHPAYSYKETERIYNSVLRNQGFAQKRKITIGTFIYICRNYGIN